MVLLDTCTLLWLADDQSQLSDNAKRAIAENAGSVFVLSISAFEIGVKQAKGKLLLPLPAEEWFEKALQNHGLIELPVTWRVAAQSATLAAIHADPCDRMLIAAARLHHLRLLTPDQLIHSYPDSRAAW